MDGYLTTQLVYVAARLGLADLLADGPQSADRLAAAAGADASTLYRILRGLAMYGLLYQAEDTFGLTDAGRYLQSGVEDTCAEPFSAAATGTTTRPPVCCTRLKAGARHFDMCTELGFSIISPPRPNGWSHSNTPW